MIAFLHGTIRTREARAIIVDVGGVGYRVYVGGNLLSRAEGEVIDVFTHLHASGETFELYGFTTADELGLFQSLIRVSGVGPRSALAILSENPADQLREAIINGDASPILRVSGIGRKTAERIILELSGTLVHKTTLESDEVLDALERLGYSRREATEALRHVDRRTGDVRERIRGALRALSKKP